MSIIQWSVEFREWGRIIPSTGGVPYWNKAYDLTETPSRHDYVSRWLTSRGQIFLKNVETKRDP